MARSLIWGSLLVALCGCISLPQWTSSKEAAPTGPVHQVHATWEPYVVVTEDPVNNGAPLPGLAGRVYLFGPIMGYPLEGNGKLDVALWDVSKGQESYLDGMSFDKFNLRKLFRKDAVGWGYSLFLPTNKLDANVTRVKVKLRYVPETGTALYAPESTLTLLRDGRPTLQHQVVAGPTKK